MITKFWERTQTKFYLLLSSCSQCAAVFWENHWSEQPLVHREILRRRNIPAAISSLWDHYCNKLEKKKKQKTLLTQGSLLFFPTEWPHPVSRGPACRSCTWLCNETSPAPWQNLCGPLSFAPTGLFLCSSWESNSRVGVSLTAHASVNCTGGHITFFFVQFLYGQSTWTTLFNSSPSQLGLDSNQPLLPVLCGPQVGASWVADRFLQGIGRRENLSWNLALSTKCGWVGAQRLGGADEQGSRLRGILLWGRQYVSRTRPLCTECSSWSVVDELGQLGLRWSGGSRRMAQGALAHS